MCVCARGALLFGPERVLLEIDNIPYGVYHSHVKLVNPSNKKLLVNRLTRAEGQLRAIREMILRDEDCTQIATQLSAVRSAVNQTLGAFAACAFAEVGSNKKTKKKDIGDIIKLVM